MGSASWRRAHTVPNLNSMHDVASEPATASSSLARARSRHGTQSNPLQALCPGGQLEEGVGRVLELALRGVELEQLRLCDLPHSLLHSARERGDPSHRISDELTVAKALQLARDNRLHRAFG